MARRLLSIWFPRLASDSSLRSRPVEGPFALTLRSGNADHLHCLNAAAQALGLQRGMALADARAICPDLTTRPADLAAEAAALAALRRWTGRYAPLVSVDGADGLMADISGVPHLFGGEAALRDDLQARLDRAGLQAQTAIAPTRGAAHALARHGGGILAEGRLLEGLGALPVTALRVDQATAEALSRMGLTRIADLAHLPRAPLARRFGPGLVLRLDQALGAQAEPVAAPPEAPHFGVRMTLPDPIGLQSDVMAGLDRLLDRLCAQLAATHRGARRLRLDLRRVDRQASQIEIGLARPMRDPARIQALFAKGVEEIDAGFGIDALRLSAPVAELNQVLHGKRSEKLNDDERQLAFEDLETALAEAETRQDAETAPRTPPRRAARRNRGHLPESLPRVERVIEPSSLLCPCGCGEMHRIGEDRTERLDIVPAQLRVIVTVRPKYACRRCAEGVTQAPAPAHLIDGGLPTEGALAHVLVSKYADHLPLYRQSQILARAGIELHRSTLADWVGTAAFHLGPVVDRLTEHLKTSSKLFMDETTAPVLDPGRGRTKTGYLWALARDDRSWGGGDPPGVVFTYAPDRAGENAERILHGFDGTLQLDGYTGYNRLTRPSRTGGAPITVAYCWAHVRRKLKEIFDRDGSKIAAEGLCRIAELYRIEAEIRGMDPGQRLSARQARSAPLIAAFGEWLQLQCRRISMRSRLGEKLAYIHRHWGGLQTFLRDGRVEIDSNNVENLIRPIALTRKNALFAGHDEGGRSWARIASLIATAKVNGVEPFAYLKATLEAVAASHPQAKIDDLLPWNFNPSS